MLWLDKMSLYIDMEKCAKILHVLDISELNGGIRENETQRARPWAAAFRQLNPQAEKSHEVRQNTE